MPYCDCLGFYGACNVQQSCRNEHNAARSIPPSGGYLDLDDGNLREFLEARGLDEEVDEEEVEVEKVVQEKVRETEVVEDVVDVVEVVQERVQEEEWKASDCHGVASQVQLFVAIFVSTLHLCVGRTSSS